MAEVLYTLMYIKAIVTSVSGKQFDTPVSVQHSQKMVWSKHQIAPLQQTGHTLM